MPETTKSKSEVFIPELAMMELAERKFKEKGEISFVLGCGGAKRLRKLIALNSSNFGRRGRSGWPARFMVSICGIRWLYHSLFCVFFDSRLNHAHSFYIIHQSVIKDVHECAYEENPKCIVVTYVRKKNPNVSWLSGIKTHSNEQVAHDASH